MEKKNIKLLLLLASVVIFIFACLTSVITISYFNRKMQCLYNGVTYNNGDSFLSSDKCNSCSCVNGSVACTLKACLNQKLQPMKGIEVYCYTQNNSLVYSILPGTNRLKSYSEVTNDTTVSSPVMYYIGKTKNESKDILVNEFSFSDAEAETALVNCSQADKLK